MDAKALIDANVSNAKHVGDLSQNAALNRYGYGFLSEWRAEVESWTCRT